MDPCEEPDESELVELEALAPDIGTVRGTESGESGESCSSSSRAVGRRARRAQTQPHQPQSVLEKPRGYRFLRTLASARVE